MARIRAKWRGSRASCSSAALNRREVAEPVCDNRKPTEWPNGPMAAALHAGGPVSGGQESGTKIHCTREPCGIESFTSEWYETEGAGENGPDRTATSTPVSSDGGAPTYVPRARGRLPSWPIAGSCWWPGRCCWSWAGRPPAPSPTASVSTSRCPASPGTRRSVRSSSTYHNGGENPPSVAVVTAPPGQGVRAGQARTMPPSPGCGGPSPACGWSTTASPSNRAFVTANGRSTFALIFEPPAKSFGADHLAAAAQSYLQKALPGYGRRP